MTIITLASCKIVAGTASVLVPAAVGSAVGGIMTGGKLLFTAASTAEALGASTAAGTSTGAIAGAIVSKTALSAVSGALMGGLSAAGVGSLVAGSIGVVTQGLAHSPIGMLVVGTSFGAENGDPTAGRGLCVTYDCWKPVVHDESRMPSRGILLKDLCCHPDVTFVDVTQSDVSDLPYVRIGNKWKETFDIEYVMLPETNQLACHANPIVKAY